MTASRIANFSCSDLLFCWASDPTAERIRDKIAASKRRGLWMGGSVPMGYDPNGRTLKVRQDEAVTIRTLYDLYETNGTVRGVKQEAEALKLRTRQRATSSGRVTGGGFFDRGHIHHILTNPIYAGRIRHKAKVHEGQHQAIIDPERWDRIQAQLQAGAVKGRGRTSVKQRSLLCGKLFDETGDRLTPSHTKTKAGIRLRYYVSHRLIKHSGQASKDGWRLPGEELERVVAHAICEHLRRPSFMVELIPCVSASHIKIAIAQIDLITADKNPAPVFVLIDRICLCPGALEISLDAARLGTLLKQDLSYSGLQALTITKPFQMRKCVITVH